MGRRIFGLFNFMSRARRSRCGPEKLLILVPSCLQRSECEQKVLNDTANCLRCGRCKVKDVLELADQHRCPLPNVPDLLEVLVERVFLLQPVHPQLAESDDRSQKVVEVVGHSARQPPHRLHLLRLNQLLFHRPKRFLGFLSNG